MPKSGKITSKHRLLFMTQRQPSSDYEKIYRLRIARQARQHAAKKKRRTRITISLVIGTVVLAAVVLGIRALGQGPSAEAPDRIRIADEGRKHLSEGSNPTYSASPPASGAHYPVWSRYGVFREPVDPGYWVHNLEHGAIVLLYSCTENCDTVAAKIEEVYGSLPNGDFGEVKLVATPYAGEFEGTFMLIAWTWQESFEIFDAARVEEFYGDFVDRGPERAP